jgi:hypothetical protein
MDFKEPHIKEQFDKAPVLLRLIAQDLEQIASFFGIQAVVTRITDPVQGESGVHLDYRALDIRDEHNGNFTYPEVLRIAIINHLNKKYPRNDGKLTCIWHSFGGAPHHFHLQISTLTKTYMV